MTRKQEKPQYATLPKLETSTRIRKRSRELYSRWKHLENAISRFLISIRAVTRAPKEVSLDFEHRQMAPFDGRWHDETELNARS